uniref:Uncharacterized protein n=1 Tax=Arundo donax TaxID=35708 RepID=A0A0A9G9D9_ARUDO
MLRYLANQLSQAVPKEKGTSLISFHRSRGFSCRRGGTHVVQHLAVRRTVRCFQLLELPYRRNLHRRQTIT